MLNEKGLIEFTIGIAGIGLSFLFDQKLSEFGVDYIDYEFITDIRPETKLRVHHDGLPQRSMEKKIFDSGNTWPFTALRENMFCRILLLSLIHLLVNSWF